MATNEELGQTRSEAPTPRRREEAREQGQVAFSADLTTGVVLLCAIGALALGAQAVSSGLVHGLRLDFLHSARADLTAEQVQNLFAGIFARGLEIVGFFFAVLVVVGIAVPALQVGFHLAPGLLGWNVERLSPAEGWSRLFSLSGSVRGVVALGKVVAIALVAYLVLRGRGVEIASLGDHRLAAGTARAWSMVVHLGLALAGTLVVLGVADYAYQRWRHEQALLMTRQELKDDLKREEGDPQVKARIRKLQREAARKRMMQDVPTATVVVTNPTHLAVALRYQAGTMAAPQVVAKGAGHIAQRIIEIARRHAVPVVERKPLAQALYKAVQVGQEIPGALYFVVAEVIAYVYRLRGGGNRN